MRAEQGWGCWQSPEERLPEESPRPPPQGSPTGVSVLPTGGLSCSSGNPPAAPVSSAAPRDSAPWDRGMLCSLSCSCPWYPWANYGDAGWPMNETFPPTVAPGPPGALCSIWRETMEPSRARLPRSALGLSHARLPRSAVEPSGTCFPGSGIRVCCCPKSNSKSVHWARKGSGRSRQPISVLSLLPATAKYPEVRSGERCRWPQPWCLHEAHLLGSKPHLAVDDCKQ